MQWPCTVLLVASNGTDATELEADETSTIQSLYDLIPEHKKIKQVVFEYEGPVVTTPCTPNTLIKDIAQGINIIRIRYTPPRRKYLL